MIVPTSSGKEKPVAGLREEALVFRQKKRQEIEEARQVAAFFLTCGIDLAAALAAGPGERERLRRKLARLIERERLRGAARHWSYDLNRHIALKQALDRLDGRSDSRKVAASPAGLRRRRSATRRGAPSARGT